MPLPAASGTYRFLSLHIKHMAVIFGRGYMPDKLVKHAATVYNRGN